MEEVLKQISPYTDDQVVQALKNLEQDTQFVKGVQFFYPNWTQNEIVQRLRLCNSCSDFQVSFIEQIIKNSIKESMDSFEIVGIENLTKPNYLYISNHRDIFLDAALLQNHLYDIGRPFTEISLGDNLMVNPTMKAIAKLNSMFTVIRSKNKSEMITNSINLSKYIRYAIQTKKVSSWIAQKNGRAKDGNDFTAPGLIKMLLLSGGEDIKKSIEELQIVVSSISYEYEPCAFEKANELYKTEKEGIYQKSKFENINSIVNGIKDYKGNVKLVFEALSFEGLDFTNNRKRDVLLIANKIDEVVYKNYQLWKTNYMGFDLLFKESKYRDYYNTRDLIHFKNYLSQSKNEDIYRRLLKIYANPVINKERLTT